MPEQIHGHMTDNIVTIIFLSLFILFSSPLSSAEEYVVYRGHYAGMFSTFMMVMGLLDGYDRGDFAGVEVSLRKSELYFDGAYGPNWWNYYFYPIRTKLPRHAVRRTLSKRLSERIALRGHQTLSRQRCYELIHKYVTIRPEILSEVKVFLKNHLDGEFLVGVHYRGTDKFNVEAPYISPEEVCSKIKNYIHTHLTTRFRIFVATDCERFLQQARKTFGEKVFFYPMKRSLNEVPIHVDPATRGYVRGKLALLDCLTLSKCDVLIRTSSNLSNASLLFNPALPALRLSDSNWGSDR